MTRRPAKPRTRTRPPTVPLNPAWMKRADGWLAEALEHLGIGADPSRDAGRIIDHVDAHGLRVVVHRQSL